MIHVVQDLVGGCITDTDDDELDVAQYYQKIGIKPTRNFLERYPSRRKLLE